MEVQGFNLSAPSVVILGAGFSAAATDGRMPLMGNFFDGLTQEDGEELFKFVSSVDCNLSKANIECVLLRLDQIRTSPDTVLFGWAHESKANLEIIQRQLASYTLARICRGLEITEDNWAAGLLYHVGKGSTVISMNYDNVAERILSDCDRGVTHGSHSGATCPHCKMKRLLDRACSCDQRSSDLQDCDWRGAVIKPHGSIAWKRCINPECCSFECLIADQTCRPFQPCKCKVCRKDCTPVLVMPTMSKNLMEVREIGVMWQAAFRAISEAESILIFGFSLPQSDELLTHMIQAGLNASRKLHEVAVIDLNPDAIIERFLRCVPADQSVRTVALPVAVGRVPDWLQDDEKTDAGMEVSAR